MSFLASGKMRNSCSGFALFVLYFISKPNFWLPTCHVAASHFITSFVRLFIQSSIPPSYKLAGSVICGNLLRRCSTNSRSFRQLCPVRAKAGSVIRWYLLRKYSTNYHMIHQLIHISPPFPLHSVPRHSVISMPFATTQQHIELFPFLPYAFFTAALVNICLRTFHR